MRLATTTPTARMMPPVVSMLVVSGRRGRLFTWASRSKRAPASRPAAAARIADDHGPQPHTEALLDSVESSHPASHVPTGEVGNKDDRQQDDSADESDRLGLSGDVPTAPTFRLSPSAAPMPVTNAASSTAVPEAVSQPKKQLPNFIPPKSSLCRPTTSVRSGAAVVSFTTV
mgnify:CR=1 FL=1